ncbi:serine hydrolase domain-containing protein [Microbacterium arborescens]
MSWRVRYKSAAYRVRHSERITVENLGPLHRGSPMLEWGSVTKTVTARIAQQLDRAEIIDLSAPVSEYLPETGLPRNVDVRSLVTHTSGLARLPSRMIETIAEARDPYAKYTTDYFDSEVLPDLSTQHGGHVGIFEYSNLGYAVLTRVLEVTTGLDWWTLAKEYVFDPLDITDVSTFPEPGRVPVLRTWTGRIREQWRDPGPFVGAGGLHGTFDALELYATSITRQTPREKPLGWMEDSSLWWHNGHNRDHGSFVGVTHDGARVITVHTLGYSAGRADRIAARLERTTS